MPNTSSHSNSNSTGTYDDHSYLLEDSTESPNQPLFIEVPSTGSLSDTGGYAVMINDSALLSSAEHSDSDKNISILPLSSQDLTTAANNIESNTAPTEVIINNPEDDFLTILEDTIEFRAQDQLEPLPIELLVTQQEVLNEDENGYISHEGEEYHHGMKQQKYPSEENQEEFDDFEDTAGGEQINALETKILGEPVLIESKKSDESYSFEKSDIGVSRSSSIGTVATNMLVNKGCDDNKSEVGPLEESPEGNSATIKNNTLFLKGSEISICSPELIQSPLPPRSPENVKRPSISLTIEDSVRMLQEEFKSPEMPKIITTPLPKQAAQFQMPTPPQTAVHSPERSPRNSQDRAQMEEAELLNHMRDSQFLWSGLFKVDSISSSDSSSINSVIREESETHSPSTASSVVSERRSLIGSGYGTIGKQQIAPKVYSPIQVIRNSQQKELTDNNNSTTNLLSKDNLYSHGKNRPYDEERLLEAVNNSEYNNLYLPIQYADIFSMRSSESNGKSFSDVYSPWRILILIIICILVPPFFFWIGLGKNCGISDFRLMKIVMSRKNRDFLYQGFIWDVDMRWLRSTCLLFGIIELLAAFTGIAVGLGVGLTR
ncbi:Bud site selection protein 9 [Nakaseomyces bracarensis]|uniref:Bud site selection protein 9 n=1 Tax=Nakaseomyces bracarensis TaxID=273131 RepID=A0ABR4NUV5_9SACH